MYNLISKRLRGMFSIRRVFFKTFWYRYQKNCEIDDFVRNKPIFNERMVQGRTGENENRPIEISEILPTVYKIIISGTYETITMLYDIA